MKKASILLLILVMICFSGCADIKYFVYQTNAGNIGYSLSFNFNEEVLADVTKAEVNEYTVNKLLEKGLQLYVNAINKNIVIQVSINSKDILSITLNNYLKQQVIESDTILFNVLFFSIEDYNKFYDINPAEIKTKVKKSFFINKIVNSQQKNFKNVINDICEAEKIKNQFPYFFKENETGFDLINFSYIYATDNKDLKSNAVYKFKSGGVYYHIWSANESGVIDISTYVIYANVTGWYILSILITAFFLIITSSVSFIKKKKICK